MLKLCVKKGETARGRNPSVLRAKPASSPREGDLNTLVSPVAGTNDLGFRQTPAKL